MALDHAAIQHIARMARIHIPDDKTHLYEDLNDILDMAAQMNDVDTTDVEPLSHPLNIVQRMRTDTITAPNQRTDLLSLTSHHEAGVYLVPKVVE